MTAPRVVVVGAGITGLSLAYLLRRGAREQGGDLEVTVLESGTEVGGHIRTIREGGYVVEGGPNGFLDREPAVSALVRGLDLDNRLVDARSESSRRYILRGGVLHRVPEGPGSLLRFGGLSLKGRLRVALEPFAPGPPAGVEETVFDFARRRIGLEAADALVDTAVAGISAGDSRQLSARAQFPLMIEMEREHGSLVRAMIARRRKGLRAPKLRSFDGGMAVLVERLVGELGDAVRTRTEVTAVGREGAAWRLRTAGGETLSADAVVLAAPANRAAAITAPLDAELSATLAQITSARVPVAAFAFRATDVPRPLDGYGYLVTKEEGLASLGVLWESSLFPGRAPDGMVLLRAMLGGARSPEIASHDAEAIGRMALDELRRVMSIAAEPQRTWLFPGPGAITQYTLGHLDRVEAIRRRAARYPGLSLCGTSYDGVSFGAAIASATACADQVLSTVNGRPVAVDS